MDRTKQQGVGISNLFVKLDNNSTWRRPIASFRESEWPALVLSRTITNVIY